MGIDFRRLFESEAAWVLGRLRWLGVASRDRQDVAQEIFGKVARRIGELDARRDVRPWLLAITCNTARDHLRRGWVRYEQLGGVDLDAVPAKESRMLERYDAEVVVRRCLDSLSYDHREVLMLVALEEFSVPEAAAILGLPEKTVTSRLARAKQRFDEALKRVRAADEHRAGAGAVLAMSADELFREARTTVDEDLDAEVEGLRARLDNMVSPPPAPAGRPIVAWVGVAVVALVAGAAAPHALTPTSAAPDCASSIAASAAPSVVSTVVPSPEVSEPLSAIATTTPSSASPPTFAATTEARAPSRTGTAAPELSEAELLALARRALREGDQRRARTALERHARAYPNGTLAAERVALLRRLQGPR